MSVDRVVALITQMSEEEQALLWKALHRHGIDANKRMWLSSPEGSVSYARLTGGSPALKAAACKSPRWAYEYARYVGGPCNETRAAACLDSGYAVTYALRVDKCPRDDTRAASLADPQDAYDYAKSVDKMPRDDTRGAAAKKGSCAFWYALSIDHGPSEVTRKGACLDPVYAAEYAIHVDGAFHADTWAAVKGTECENAYWEVGVPPEAQ